MHFLDRMALLRDVALRKSRGYMHNQRVRWPVCHIISTGNVSKSPCGGSFNRPRNLGAFQKSLRRHLRPPVTATKKPRSFILRSTPKALIQAKHV